MGLVSMKPNRPMDSVYYSGWNLYIAKFYAMGSIVGSVSAEAWFALQDHGVNPLVTIGACELPTKIRQKQPG